LLTKPKEDLTNYNTCLKQENDELRDWLNTMSLALSNLNQEVKDTENEMLSLVTALKMLYEEKKRIPQDKDQTHTHANLGKQTNNNGEQTYSMVGENKI
jgi:predicted nuclease with TOPRIM domain